MVISGGSPAAGDPDGIADRQRADADGQAARPQLVHVVRQALCATHPSAAVVPKLRGSYSQTTSQDSCGVSAVRTSRSVRVAQRARGAYFYNC